MRDEGKTGGSEGERVRKWESGRKSRGRQSLAAGE
jgi:hypothetical protein